MKWLILHIKKYHLAFILFCGAVLRLNGIKSRDFWFDEAFTGILLREPWGRMMEIIISDTHPPLYYFLLKPIGALFHYSPVSLRSLSFLWGMVTLYLVYRFTKELFSERAAIYATSIAALSPFAIYYSQEARSYAMLAGSIMVACYCFMLALRTKQLGWFATWGMVMGLACLTHYMALICTPLFAGIWYLHERQSREKKIEYTGVCLGYFVQLILFLPWLPFFLKQFRNREDLIQWIEPATIPYVFETLTIFFFGSPKGDLGMGMQVANTVQYIPEMTVLFIVSVGCIVSAISLWYKEKKYRSFILLLSGGYIAVVYLLKYFDAYYFIPRYFIAAAYVLFIMCGVALSHTKKIISHCIVIAYTVTLLLITPLDPSVGFGLLAKDKKYLTNYTLYTLNTYDYLIAKYYYGYDAVVLYNIDWPAYDPSVWLGINGSLLRVEHIEEVLQDERGVILLNTHSPTRDSWELFVQKNNLLFKEKIGNIILYTKNTQK